MNSKILKLKEFLEEAASPRGAPLPACYAKNTNCPFLDQGAAAHWARGRDALG
jgi:hypothetical protein